jgi:hypothetical protein
MMILQKKKNSQYTIKLCYKVFFFFRKTKIHFKYEPLSYLGIMNIYNVVFLKKKVLYNRLFKITTIYNIPLFFQDFYNICIEFR